MSSSIVAHNEVNIPLTIKPETSDSPAAIKDSNVSRLSAASGALGGEMVKHFKPEDTSCTVIDSLRKLQQLSDTPENQKFINDIVAELAFGVQARFGDKAKNVETFVFARLAEPKAVNNPPVVEVKKGIEADDDSDTASFHSAAEFPEDRDPGIVSRFVDGFKSLLGSSPTTTPTNQGMTEKLGKVAEEKEIQAKVDHQIKEVQKQQKAEAERKQAEVERKLAEAEKKQKEVEKQQKIEAEKKQAEVEKNQAEAEKQKKEAEIEAIKKEINGLNDPADIEKFIDDIKGSINSLGGDLADAKLSVVEHLRHAETLNRKKAEQLDKQAATDSEIEAFLAGSKSSAFIC